MIVTDELIDACGFRMFALDEIARTMVMHEHPRGGDYVVHGNKREVMAQLGNAVTPPATRLKLERIFDVIGGGGTFTDLFCGAGGSSIGAEIAGGELRLGLNHWDRAIETHATNFPDADHDCADVSALTTAQIRRYPDSDILLASPECTNHSLAKGSRRRSPQAASLFEDGPAGDEEQDRSRATMWDVARFAEQKILKGKPYKAIIVENVVDAFRWGAEDNGGLFENWRRAIESLGYSSEIVWLNSMFAWPTPQSRDRMYVVFWRKGIKAPNFRVEPVSWCPGCERIVEGRQTWKQPGRPHHTAQGKPVGARYGAQYLYGCPDCRSYVLPGVFPAATAIDWSLVAPLIGERARPLATNTRERIRRGLELTPYSRTEFLHCVDTWRTVEEDVERARRFYVVVSQCFGGHAVKDDRSGKRGWGGERLGRMHLCRAASTKNRVDNIWRFVDRMRSVQVDNLDWRACLERYDHEDALFYLDPPYVPATRRSGSYSHELTTEDHEELVARVLELQGVAIVSGYDHPIYEPLVSGGGLHAA